MKRLATLVAILAIPSVAGAHHTTATNRAGGGARLGLGGQLTGADLPRVEARLSHELSVFDRRIEGTERFDNGDAVLINTLTPALSGTLDSGTGLALSLPIGLLWTNPEDGDAATSAGLGDLSLTIAQDILRLVGRPGDSGLFLRAIAGLVAPTGRYDEDAAVSITDVVGGDVGAINLVTYDTRASLGAGSWALSGGLDGGFRASPRWTLSAGFRALSPVSRTKDGIRWGVDLLTQVGLTFVPIPDRLAVRFELDHRHHTKDSVPGIDEATGTYVLSDVGGRDELGAALAVDLGLSRNLQCGLRAHLPVWQRAGGVQLVETLSTQLGCGYAWSL